MRSICKVDGCGRPVKGYGWCQNHLAKARRRGWRSPPRPTLEERLWSKVDKAGPIPAERPDLGRCWVWTASLNSMGYGQLMVVEAPGRRRPNRAHRLAYELTVGPIPEGLELDHLCCNKRCVNPAHLEPVTHAENVRRAVANDETCRNGHPRTEANTYRWGGRNGHRTCRICSAEGQRRRYEEKKAS